MVEEGPLSLPLLECQVSVWPQWYYPGSFITRINGFSDSCIQPDDGLIRNGRNM